MTDLSKKILTTIKAAKIHPHSKLHFQILNWGLWALLALLIFIGSLSFGLSFHIFETADWDLQPLLTPSLPKFIFLTIPWFWLILILIITIIAIHFFKNTKQGHKITPTLILTAIIFLSLIGGGVIHATQISSKIEIMIDQKMPFLRGLHRPQNRLWQNPDQGFLGGRIMEIPGTGQFTLKSHDGEVWQIDFPDFPSSTLMTDQPVRLRGEIMDDGHFSATEFRSKNCPLSSDHRFCQMQPKPFQRLKEFFLPPSIIK